MPQRSRKILGHVGDITRFPTPDHFASYTGTAPIEASSGEHRRYCLNPTGNRQLNTALHTIAICQARDPGPGRTYYLRKISEGKTPAEARRALKDASPTSSTGNSTMTNKVCPAGPLDAQRRS